MDGMVSFVTVMIKSRIFPWEITNYTASCPILSKELFKLTNLMTLHLQHGQFTGAMPSEIGRLTNLQDLNICGNNLRGRIPLEIGTLTKLRSLDLSENQFTGTIPPQISTLVNLEIFAIHQREGVSNIGGPLVPAFDDFPCLKEEVDLENNALTVWAITDYKERFQHHSMP